MAPSVEISIPSTQLSNTPKAYTLYNISLRLPIRSFIVQKRYSEFTELDSSLKSQASASPPIHLPAKSWFQSTISNQDFTEQRRQGLETYIQAINTSEDPRWRDTSAWRTFLNLPSNLSLQSSTVSSLRSTACGSEAITDPVVWLDCHRDLKAKLHSARLHITQREQATNSQAQHESSAQAKKCLVKSGTTIQSLEQGLKSQDDWGSEKLGDGEVRRRRDLVSSAKKEKETLENLLNAMIAKSRVDTTVDDKKALINGPASNAKPGRVLGKETKQTRELDNNGVLQLQKQMMEEQDEDVIVLAKAVRRQKELGLAIQEELVVQNEMLGMLDEDVTRVQGKIDIARKRVSKIS